ncbi:hypothetical protein DFP72DRAFT_887126 [Ephemerocybe angulata]|uniref:Elongator complex protein 6 n=1 Tax=Ephemerocybe angulata TaxID=980116 RepID=A0A8H6I6U2_9AGAR|nr:hypothetical protein DFP72DRAFT_887126 [Tulosesus angulatus]
MFSPFDIPSGAFTLITDELSAPADFLLHGAVNACIKEHATKARVPGLRAKSESGAGPTVLVLSSSVDLARWKAISSKQNVNLAQHLTNGTVKFVDVACEEGGEMYLSSVFNSISANVGSSSDVLSERLVILDDVSTLEWIGFSPLDIMRFVRALRISCHKANWTFIVRYHVVTPNKVDEQLQQLLGICTYHLDVRPLYSGRSGAVSGEIALHRGAAARQDEVKLIKRSGSLQYRLLDTGPVYFQKGTSEGVL